MCAFDAPSARRRRPPGCGRVVPGVPQRLVPDDHKKLLAHVEVVDVVQRGHLVELIVVVFAVAVQRLCLGNLGGIRSGEGGGKKGSGGGKHHARCARCNERPTLMGPYGDERLRSVVDPIAVALGTFWRWLALAHWQFREGRNKASDER